MLDGKTIFATLPAYDLERASHFYEDKLGLHRADLEVPGGIIYQTNGNQFLVYKTDAPRGGTTAASFLVDDLEAEMRELRDKGVEFEEYDHAGPEDRAWGGRVRGRQGGMVQGFRGQHPRVDADVAIDRLRAGKPGQYAGAHWPPRRRPRFVQAGRPTCA